MTEFRAAGLADLHNHLLPLVDDGTRSLEETLRYLTLFAAEGVTRLAVSPHLSGWLVDEPAALRARLDELERAFAELERACIDRSDVPGLVFGQEILLMDAETAREVAAEPRAGYRGTRYLLTEFGFRLDGDRRGVIEALVAAGRKPIVAHPERYVRAHARVSVEELTAWRDAGALLQINGGSFVGAYGASVEQQAWAMLEAGLADLVSSDHHGDARQVSPATVGRELAARGAGEQARLLLAENPQHVLADRETLAVPCWRSRAA